MNPQRRIDDMRRVQRPQVPTNRPLVRPAPIAPIAPRPPLGAPTRPVAARQAMLPPSPTYGAPRLEPPHHNRRWLIIALVLLALVILAGAAWFAFGRKKTPAVSKTNATGAVTAINSPDTIHLLATGDFIAHDSVNAAAAQAGGGYNYLPLMSDFLPILKKADIRFCNDPILNGGKQFGIAGYPKFNSPTEFVTDMGKLGCNVVNTASNHSFDFTQETITASVQAWAGVPNMLAVAGENQSQAQHDTVHYFTVKGVKFAFLAYTTYSNNDSPVANQYGVNIFSESFAKSQIDAAKQNGAQFIIASMRWGTEYSTTVNAEQKADAQFLANQGVSLVLGHGSHELQSVQELTGTGGNKATVWYSLGNFINTQEPPETLFNGLANITINTKTKQIASMNYLPIYMHYEWTAAQAAADATSSRNHVHVYLLENTVQAMVDAQQLKTTIPAQKQRLSSTLNANGLTIPLITSKEYLAQN